MKSDIALINKRKNTGRGYNKNSLHIEGQYGLPNQAWIYGVGWDDEKEKHKMFKKAKIYHPIKNYV